MGHGLADAERIADRQHHVADLELVGVAKFERGKALVRALDAQYGKIAALIAEHNVGIEFALVGQRHFDLAGAADDVEIGDDQPRRIDDNTRAERALDLPARDPAEELAKERIGHERVLVLDDVGGVDVDHCGRHPLHDRRKRHLQLGERGWHVALLRARDV